MQGNPQQQPPPPPPPQQQQQQQQQTQQQQPFYSDYKRPSADNLVQQAYPPSASAGIGALFQKNLVFAGVLVGGLIVFIAALICINTTDPDVFEAGQMMKSLGGAIMFFLALGGGLLSASIDKYGKAGLLVASGLFATMIF